MKSFNKYMTGLFVGILFLTLQSEALAQLSKEVESPSKKSITVNLYPNPSNGDFRIEMNVKEKGKLTAKLFDMTGKLVEDVSGQMSFDLGKVSGDVRMEDPSPGIYFLRVEIGEESGSKKIMIR